MTKHTVKLYVNNQEIAFSSATWSGSASQAARELSFTIPNSPYDKTVTRPSIPLGAVIKFNYNKTTLFVGTVTSREVKGAVGTVSYTAVDFLNNMLKSTATYKFKKTTPEAIAKKIASSVGGKVGSLVATHFNITKLYLENTSLYDIVARAYKKHTAESGQAYMQVMAGNKYSVIKKGQSSNVVLTQGDNITGAVYTENLDEMIDKVLIYDDKGKKVGEVSNSGEISKYGVYQTTYSKESGVNATTAAKQLLVGVKKEGTVEGIGDPRCMSGYTVVVKDKIGSGLKATFLITEDSHTFENGQHTMSLTLRVGKTYTNASKSSAKKVRTADSTCYYIPGASAYHSSANCTYIAGKAHKTGIVKTVKNLKNSKGRRLYKPCSKCWK